MFVLCMSAVPRYVVHTLGITLFAVFGRTLARPKPRNGTVDPGSRRLWRSLRGILLI